MKDQPAIFFNKYQHPFGHTSGASDIILTDPIYRLVAGGETSPWTKPSGDISPRGVPALRFEPRTLCYPTQG
jgi:hypothetical protein